MQKDAPAPARTLTSREVMDLVRAGIVLAVTVYLTMIVPPQVWGAEPEQAPASVEQPK